MSSEVTAVGRPEGSDPASLLRLSVARAASALCAMINVDVDPGPVHTATDVVPVRVPSVAVRLGLGGELRGTIVLLVPQAGALAELMSVPEHLVTSAVAEVGNIIGSHLMIGLEDATGLSLSITPPELTEDLAVEQAWVQTAQQAWVELTCRSPITVVVSLQDPPADTPPPP